MLSSHTSLLGRPAALRLRNRFMTVTLLSVGLGGTALAETLPETTRKTPPAPDMARLHTVSSSTARPITGPHAALPAKPQAAPAQPKWYGVFGGANGAASGFGTVGPYGQARWAEDWSFLADGNTAAKRHDWFDRLKYISLNDSGSIWLTLSGEERLRYIFGSCHVNCSVIERSDEQRGCELQKASFSTRSDRACGMAVFPVSAEFPPD